MIFGRLQQWEVDMINVATAAYAPEYIRNNLAYYDPERTMQLRMQLAARHAHRLGVDMSGQAGLSVYPAPRSAAAPDEIPMPVHENVFRVDGQVIFRNGEMTEMLQQARL